jgi:hypothetical protein
MSALGQKRTCGKLRSVTWFAKACAQLSGPAYVEASYEVGDGMETVTCHCGAIYETIEAKGPTKDQSPFKCVLSEKELSTRTNVQFRLRQQPEQDRE